MDDLIYCQTPNMSEMNTKSLKEGTTLAFYRVNVDLIVKEGKILHLLRSNIITLPFKKTAYKTSIKNSSPTSHKRSFQ